MVMRWWHILGQNRMRAELRGVAAAESENSEISELFGNQWMGGRTVVASPRAWQRRAYEQSRVIDNLNRGWLESWRIVQGTWIQSHQNSSAFQPWGLQCAQSTKCR